MHLIRNQEYLQGYRGFESPSLLLKNSFLFWRGGRVVEGARLEIVYTAKSGIEGSNPSLSAFYNQS